MKTASSNSKYKKEIEECTAAFNIEHRLYNEDSYFIKFFKFPENHSQRIRNTDTREIGKHFDKNISQKVIANLVSRHNGPNIALNLIRNHVFGNLDLFHRFFYETLLDSEAFNEMVRVCTKLNYHVSDKDEDTLIDQANNLRERFYGLVADGYRMSHKGPKSKNDKSKNGNIQSSLNNGGIGSINDIGGIGIAPGIPINMIGLPSMTQIAPPINPAMTQMQQTMQAMQIIHPEVMMNPIQMQQQPHISQQPYQDDAVEGNNDGHPEEMHDIF